MASLRAGCAAGGPRLPETHAGRPAALRLLLLLGAVLKPQESLAQLHPTPGNLESKAALKPQESLTQLHPTPGNLEFKGKTVAESYETVITRLCWQIYKNELDSVEKDWCDWAVISRPYSDLRSCLEHWAEEYMLGFPNPWAEQIIFETHQIHFANCSLVQPTFSDPPENVLLAMIIAPICLIPFLVTLVVWRSKDSEAQG
ncbi:receptor activity-modifying protein 2-like [Talpa occidentalis]|uniref:receptor activity-modifying protein 2-like n=1 Tax=Talpa occidentalis TaxID=50954 RepID=UPI0023F8224D|nr:receptor activity-modifying protein 2-like [Talpa occidentalis]